MVLVILFNGGEEWEILMAKLRIANFNGSCNLVCERLNNIKGIYGWKERK